MKKYYILVLLFFGFIVQSCASDFNFKQQIKVIEKDDSIKFINKDIVFDIYLLDGTILKEFYFFKKELNKIGIVWSKTKISLTLRQYEEALSIILQFFKTKYPKAILSSINTDILNVKSTNNEIMQKIRKFMQQNNAIVNWQEESLKKIIVNTLNNTKQKEITCKLVQRALSQKCHNQEFDGDPIPLLPNFNKKKTWKELSKEDNLLPFGLPFHIRL